MDILPSTELLPAREVWRRYGVVSKTIDRWERDPRLSFPKAIVVNKRRYWRTADLVDWERSRVRAANGKAV